MKRILLAILFVLISWDSASALKEEIPCVAGYCEGWVLYIEKGSSFSNYSNFKLENHTGYTAFMVQVLINYYDYFDKYLGRHELKADGPIREKVPFSASVPEDTRKITYEIYWTDEYSFWEK